LAEEEVFIRAARGTGALSLQSIVNSLLGLAFFMVFARMVSKAEMGVYGAAFLVFSLLAIIGNLGLSFAATRFPPYYHGRHDAENVLASSKRILVLTLALSTALLAASYPFTDFLSTLLFNTPSNSPLLKLVVAASAISVVGLTLDGLLRGLQKYASLAILRVASQVLRVAVSIGLLLLGFSVAAVFIGWISFYAALAALAALLAVKTLRELKKHSSSNPVDEPTIPFKALLTFSLPMMAYRLVTYLSNTVDQYIVLGYLGTKPLGVYTVVITASSSIILILIAPLTSTLIPSMSETYGKAGGEKLAEAFKLTTRYVSLIFIPACLGFTALTPLIIEILAGPTYAEAILPLAIISLGIAIYGYSAALLSALTALGKTSRVATAILLASLVEFTLCLFLVPALSVIGAALSRALTYTAMLGLLTALSHKLIDLSLDREALLKSGAASITMALIVSSAAWTTSYKLTLLPLYLALGALTYLLLLTLSRALTPIDAELLKKTLPKGQQIFKHLEKLAENSPLLKRTLLYWVSPRRPDNNE